MFRRKNTGRTPTGKVQNGSCLHLFKRYTAHVRTLIIGCGYVGEALGQRLVALGHEVTGVRRDSDGNERLAKRGIQPLNLDIIQPESFNSITEVYENVVIAVSSSRGGREAYQQIFQVGIENVANWLKNTQTRSVVFISSTSVYRQTNGEWVDENSETRGNTTSSSTLGAAEKQIASTNCCTTILRSSGIYGPGRGYLFQQFMKGAAQIDGTGERFLNMVHRDDLAEAILHSFSGKGGIFNITDNEPISLLNFFKWLSESTGKPLPSFVPEPDPATRKRGLTNKRVSNHLFKEFHDYQYKYSTFREGLAKELENDMA